MWRRLGAALVDAAGATALAFAGFRLGEVLAQCADPAECFPQIPLGLVGAVLPIVLYFWLAQRAWGMTLGERLVVRRRA